MATPKLSDQLKERIEYLLAKGRTHRQISKELGVGTGTVANVRAGKNLDGQLEAMRSRAREKEISQRYKEALREIERLNKELASTTLMNSYVSGRKPVDIKARGGSKQGEAVAAIDVGDWHIEERIACKAVNGVNEFNLDVAKKRIEELWQTSASLVDMCKSRSRIDTIVVNLLGDFISGYLHEELTASNGLTPAEAILLAYDYLVGGIDFLVRETKAKKIIVPCVCGNHGRFTKQRWAKLGPGVSLEYLLYAMIDKWFRRKKDNRVEVIMPTGSMTYLTVYGRKIRIMHGDAVRYSGGVGGVHIPLRKAIDAWNTQVRADYNVLGHWHSDMVGEDYRINGCLVGYSEYSLKIKARYHPPSQAFEIWHPRYGATARFPMILP